MDKNTALLSYHNNSDDTNLQITTS